MKVLRTLCYALALFSIPASFSSPDDPPDSPDLERSGRRLKLFSKGLGASIDIRSNNQAFSASVGVTPSYITTLISDDVGRRDGGVAAALAYALDVDPANWYAYATGDDIDDNLLRLLARGPYAGTYASLEKDGGELSGEAYANAQGNLIAFSRAYVHLLQEADRKGVDLAARSQARGKAVSEKVRDDLTLRDLYGRFYDEYESEASVLAVVNAEVAKGEATANQNAEARTDDDLRGTHCARVWLRGEAVEGVELSEEDLLVRGVNFEMFEC